MPFHRLRRLIQGQGGSTLIELLVAMPIAVLLLGIVVQALGSAGLRQRDVENRTETLTQAQIGLERMTRELRQARWVYVRSSSAIDLEVLVRSGAPRGVARLVRYDCSTDACVRSEGAAVAYPPPAGAPFDTSAIVIGAADGDTLARQGTVVGHDIFRPLRTDPATGATVPEYADPDTLLITLKVRAPGRRAPMELMDGVGLRNRSTFAS